jgi:A/G-specific adenine glycosylase
LSSLFCIAKTFVMLEKKRVINFQNQLLDWYDQEFRDLPWRSATDPYRIWVSEIMLQQTQVIKVIPYYEKFVKTFPNINALAKANLAAVLKIWEGLGYYARARNLHKAARFIEAEFNGQFPRQVSDILLLPGIGPYTAAAIASIVYSENMAVVDGNVNRVLARLYQLKEDPKSTSGKKRFQQLADAKLSKTRPGDYNQAMMELGAVICKPRSPICAKCPVQNYCGSYKSQTQSLFPTKSPKKERPHNNIAVGIVEQDGKILIAQRPENKMLGGLWEFPGGKVEKNESLEETTVRELKEELGINVVVDRYFTSVDFQYTHMSITLHAFFCTLISGTPQAIECTAWKWVGRNDLLEYAFPKANKTILKALLLAS